VFEDAGAVRIAMLAAGDGANAQYRVFAPMEALGARGHRMFGAVFETVRNPGALLDYDVVYGWRLHGAAFGRVARMLADARIGFVWDNDDNLAAIDVKGRPNHRFFSGLSGQRIAGEMSAMMRIADVVTTPSEALAAHYREATGADVRVLENYVEVVQPRTVSKRADQVVVGWVAHVEHQTDIERLRLREPMQRLLDRHPQVHVVCVGCGLGLEGERYHHIKRVPFEELRGYVSSFDIGIAPICDSEFNRGRSSVKVKEYAAMGVPWLASPIGPYTGLGKAEGGQLVPDDRWFEELERLVLDARGRAKLAKRAAKWARSQTIAENAARWEAVLDHAVKRARER
jgi:glycosyltransferase involved in cell wall biosynthesis